MVLRNPSDQHHIRPPQAALQHARTGHLGKGNYLGDQTLHRCAAALYENQLHIKPIFAEKSTLLRDPQWRHVR